MQARNSLTNLSPNPARSETPGPSYNSVLAFPSCLCAEVFNAHVIPAFFAETFWSLKYFGRLPHSFIKARCNSIH